MNEFYVKTLEKKAIGKKKWNSDFIVVPHLKSCNEFFYNECYSQLKSMLNGPKTRCSVVVVPSN